LNWSSCSWFSFIFSLLGRFQIIVRVFLFGGQAVAAAIG
jgi:hypothetical protein